MKYFTKEMWLGSNMGDEIAKGQNTALYERNFKEYARELESVLPRLNEADRSFFSEDLHDGRLISLTVGDEIDFDSEVSDTFGTNSHNTSARMKLMGPYLDYLFTVEYSGVRRVFFDYPTDDALFHGEGRHIGDWGYDELTLADDTYLRHEILFASGTSILIEFMQFSHKKHTLIEATEKTRT